MSTDDFEQFAVRELPGLLRHAVMLTGDRDSARDLVQDVMVKAHSRWELISAADRPNLYLRTMATRAFISSRRRWSIRHVFLTPTGDIRGGEIGDLAEAVVNYDEIWRLLATLPAKQRAVLVLRYYQGMTDDEIADVLHCSSGTVRGYASRALASLRLELAPEPQLHESNLRGETP